MRRRTWGRNTNKFRMHTTRALVLLVAGIGVGYVLLLFVYLLPTEPMRELMAVAAGVL